MVASKDKDSAMEKAAGPFKGPAPRPGLSGVPVPLLLSFACSSLPY